MPDIPPNILPLYAAVREIVAQDYVFAPPDNPVKLRFGTRIHPGLALDKLGPTPGAVKDHQVPYYESWRDIADSAKRPDLVTVAERLIERRAATLALSVAPHERLEAQVVWRMVLGLSTPNPLETSLTLHPQYGIPVIPGSSVKGLVRAWCLWSLGDDLGVRPLPFGEYRRRKLEEKGGKWQKRSAPTPTHLERLEALLIAMDVTERAAMLKALKDDVAETAVRLAHKEWRALPEAIRPKEPPKPPAANIVGMDLATLLNDDRAAHFLAVFGATDAQGGVTFQDALPVAWIYVVDVMTPHYGDYYTGDKPPADWMEPTPIPFLTIGSGSRFEFAVTASSEQANGDDLVNTARKWLAKAVQEFGVGGKTLGGYGEMN